MERKNIGWEPEYQRALYEFIMDAGKISRGTAAPHVDISSPLVKYKENETPRYILKTPILSAAMQSVTGHAMAIEMAKLGGAGVIYASQEPEQEAEMVRKVKSYRAGFVIPEVFSPETSLETVQNVIESKGFSTFPITDNGLPDGELVGYLTENDFFLKKHSGQKVKDRMISVKDGKVVFRRLEQILDDADHPDLNIANDFLLESHHGSLPIVDEKMRLKYVVFRRDARATLENPLQLVDKSKRLFVGAAIRTREDDYATRVPLLIDAGADFIVIDTSQAFSDYAGDTLKYLKGHAPDMPAIAGNVINEEGFYFLAERGADAVKTGMGSGSICSTKEQNRVGSGQANAVVHVAKARDEWFECEGEYIPIISDGGVRTAGDILVALALGADMVMVGGYIAGTNESPTEIIRKRVEVDSRIVELLFKPYCGEGTAKAAEWAKDRYGQSDFEEGFETIVPYVGPLAPLMRDAVSKIKDGARKAGCMNIKSLHKDSVLKVVGEVEQETSAEKYSKIKI